MVFDERAVAILTDGGVDVQSVMNSWAKGHESLYLKHLHRFADNHNLEEFIGGLESGDLMTAYRGIHTLKGVCANLGMKGLYQLALEGAEAMKDPDEQKQREARANGEAVALRSVVPQEVTAMIPQLKAERDRMVALVAQLDE